MQPEQQQRIMGYFIEEAKDHLNTIEQGLLNLQGTLDDSEMVNEVFRAAHSVKGGAAMLGLSGIQHASHQLEDYFKILKETPGIRADQKLETLLLQVSDTLSSLLEQLQLPFGLTEEASEAAINAARPVFQQVEQHLKYLTSIANPNAVSTRISSTAMSSQTLIFQQQVPILMRELLVLFKQLDSNPAIRQPLQDRFDDLISLTAFFQLSGWNYLIGLISRAIESPENSGRVMAGVIIKELKQAQEHVLADHDSAIVPSSAVMNLVPLAIKPASSAAVLSNSHDLFGDDSFDDLFSGEGEAVGDDLDLELDFDALATSNEGGIADNDALFGDLEGLNDLNLDVAGGNDFASLLEGSGPEMGIAELNSLADLFEGEVPDLTSTWQEEELLTGSRDQSTALNLDDDPTSLDFEAFLLEPESADTGLRDHSLEDLFGDDLLADLSEPFAFESPTAIDSAEDFFDLSFLDDVGEPDAPAEEDALGLSMFDTDVSENTLSENELEFDDPLELFSADRVVVDLTDDAASSLSELGDLFMGFDDSDLSFGESFGELGSIAELNAMDDFDDLNLTMGRSGGSDFGDLFSLSEESPVSQASPTDDLMGVTELFAAEGTVTSNDRSWSSVSNGLSFGGTLALDDRSLLEDFGTEDDAFSFLNEDSPTLLDLTDPDAESALFDNLSNPLFSEGRESDTRIQFDPDLHLNSLGMTDDDWTMPGTDLDYELGQLIQDQQEPDFLSELDELEGIVGLDDLRGLDDLSGLDELGGLDDLDDLDDLGIGNLDSLSGLDDLEGPDNISIPEMNVTDDPWADFDQDSALASVDLTTDNLTTDLATDLSLGSLEVDDLDFSGLDLDELDLGDLGGDLDSDPFDLDSLESFDRSDFDRLGIDSAEMNSLEASISYDDMELPIDVWDDLPSDALSEDPIDNESGGLSELDVLLGGAALGAIGVGAASMMKARSAPVEAPIEGVKTPIDPEFDLDVLGDGDLDDLDFDDLGNLNLGAGNSDFANSLEDLDELNLDDLDLGDLDFGAGDNADNRMMSELAIDPLDSFAATDSDFDEIQNNLQIDDFGDDDFGDLDRLLNGTASQSTAAPDPFMDLEELLSSNLEMAIGATAVAVTAIRVSAFTSSVLDDPEFGDLERLLEDSDQSIIAPAAGSRGAAATRRTVRPSSKGFSEQTMRVPVKHLDNLSNLVGELVVNRNTLEQDQERLRQSLDNLLYQVQQLSDVGQRMQDLYERSLLESSLLASRQSYRMAGSIFSPAVVDPERSNDMEYDPLEMDRFTGFHSLSQEMIELIVRVRESASDIEFIVDETDQVTRNFRQVTTQLQEGLTRSRMVPFAQTADRLPRAVRDIAMKCGKQAELLIEGRETPIDKMLLEHLYDPMTHLVNNAITHGIETPEERRLAGKPETGRISIRAFHQGNQTVISVSDDGAGVDIDRVKQKAIEKNLITVSESQTMGRIDVYDLLFHPGFTTRDQADDFAGRGVGMDVVRTSLSEIRGVVTTDSTLGKGTTFTIRLPLTLSISKALCCISDRARIAFPMDGVEDMLDMPKDRLHRNAEGQPYIVWRDNELLLRPLTELLAHNRHLGRGNVYGGSQDEDTVSVVVLRSAGNYLALQVDQVLGEQEIVIKQLEGPVPKPVGIAGATVLGDGRIMPIADALELIDLSMGRIRRDSGSMWEQTGGITVEALPAKTEPMVLIVDDSITVRELLSMTFNKVGYRVEQARDGQEAWEKLRSGLPCDIVFCDIEMPRMDGLELLSRIQKDPNLKSLPIAMLTSRGADRHRQMASSLGASGYFTKPYLEEALLDAAARMLKGEVLLIADREE